MSFITGPIQKKWTIKKEHELSKEATVKFSWLLARMRLRQKE
jgi:hypothetical protein